MGHIEQLDEKTFAFGLTWRFYEEGRFSVDDASYKLEAAEKGAKGVVAHDGRGMRSLGLAYDEETIAIISAASTAAQWQLDAWLGVFKLPSGVFWVIGCAEGHIIPGADIIEASFDEAKTRMISLEQAFPSGVQFVTNIEGHEGWEIYTLQEVLSSDGRRITYASVALGARLRELVKSQSKKLLIAATFVFIILLIISVIKSDIDRKKQEAERQAALELKVLREKEKEEEERAALLRLKDNWEKATVPSQYIAECRVALRRLSLPIAGWNRVARECEGPSAMVTWAEGRGRLKRIQTLISARDAQLEQHGGVFVSRSLLRLERLHKISYIATKEKAANMLPLYNGNEEVSFQWGQDKLLTNATLKYEGQHVFRQDWAFRNVIDVATLGAYLDGVNGLTVTEVKQRTDGFWDVSGILFYVASDIAVH